MTVGSGFISEERRKKQKIEQQAEADAKRAWKDKVKHITPVLLAAEKNKDDKASSFPQIRGFLKKKCKPSKTEFATWTAENIVQLNPANIWHDPGPPPFPLSFQ